MRYWRWLILLLATKAFAAVSAQDDTGQVLRLVQPAQRVVSLAPDITEILFAIDAGNRTVGVIAGSNYPIAAQKIPVVGSYVGIDIERVIALHPDLIVAWQGTFTRPLAALQQMGIPVYWTKPRQLEDVPRTMRQLGKLAAVEHQANQAAAAFSMQIAGLKQRYQAATPVTVFYQIGSYTLMTINQDSWINQVIALCGGRNVFATMRIIAPEVGWEAVVTANPEVIISDAENDDWRVRWQKWPRMRAISRGTMYRIDPDLIERAGPRLAQGAALMCEYLNQARKA